MIQFQTLKNDLTKTRVYRGHDSVEDLVEGEIVVKVERFAFTANNITYGVAGDTIGYWKFFPALDDPEGKWGCIPMWGFAEIIHSNNAGLKVGERIFGYFPAADTLVIDPIKISDQSFSDGKEHRQELPPVYNNYLRLDSERDYDRSSDNIRALLFPLHVTAFCLCDALQEESYLGASQVVIVSASSKTGIGLAQGLSDQEQAPGIIGLTSSSNVDFVEGLGCYDEVFAYDQLEKVNSDVSSVIVDMAGNREVLGTLHGAMSENMLKCFTVGMTHWDNETTPEDVLAQMMTRDRTEFFFAPAHIQKRISDWGQEGYSENTKVFLEARIRQSDAWMQVKEIFGLDDFVSVYNRMVAGVVEPNQGIIVVNE